MVTRIKIYSKVFDARSAVRKKRLQEIGFTSIKDLWLADVYTIEKKLTAIQLQKFTSILTNPVTQEAYIATNFVHCHSEPRFNRGEESPANAEKTSLKQVQRSLDFSRHGRDSLGMTKSGWVIEIGFLPGVTDNLAATAKEMMEDLLKIKFNKDEGLYSSQITFVTGNLIREDMEKIGMSFANPLINRIHIKNFSEYQKNGGMDFVVPKVKLKEKINVSQVNLNVPDEELIKIGKVGIANPDGTRRGPLALSLSHMKTIQSYFKRLGRNPTDVELESLAQTWSEHCKHTIFADPLDEIKGGLFKTYIRGATEEIRRKKGKLDKCVSVFSDNSGAVSFDEKYLITHKVETHNTPSALDPFGGAITGIVGVNRDTIGFGMGAKPVANCYGFCFADPRKDVPLYKGSNFAQKMLSSRRILDGVVEGVNAGGNQSGIPTPSGFIYFDERYRGKPLVFVGTIGLIPKKIKSKFSHLKKATPGDYIVMIGGRVGKDGIHGATFSSEGLNSGSPVTAVQIGDPITQKKLSDALIMEARDLLLYNSITDNGAGGLSCSVAEMAKESGGCWVELEKVPLKYPGLSPWEIWISESQERMTLAIPPKKWKKFYTLMKKRGVEATVIGKFTNSGKCIVVYNGKVVMDIDMQFLHYGLPKRPMKTRYPHHSGLSRIDSGVASLPRMTVKDLTKLFLSMLGRLNIASFEFISQQYDYMVLGNSVLGPLQGKGRINADTAAIRPLLDSKKCLIISCGLYPSYSDIDTYIMAAASLDTAIRNVVAAGGDLDKIYLLDNFCWYDSYNPIRLRELKRAAQACYDYATLYQTPFISGKDSMFNDFAGFDKNGKAIKISIPPTLLITSVGIIDDFMKVVSLDAKIPGDLVYILGETYDELGGSEYCSSGGAVPRVDAAKNKKLYKAFSHAIRKNLISSSISCGRGGLAIALAKKALGGKLGIEISLKNIPGEVSRDDFALFSESQGRIVVTVHPERKKQFEKIMRGNSFAKIGKVLQNKLIIIKGLKSNVIVNTNIDKALKSYRKTFEGY